MFNRTESHTSPTCGPVPPAPCTVQGPETLGAAFYLKARLACSVSHTRDVTCGGVWGPDAGTRLQTLPGGEPPPQTPAKVWLKRRNEQIMETLRRQGTPGSVALGLPKLWLQRGRRPPMPRALGHTPVTLKTPGLRSMHEPVARAGLLPSQPLGRERALGELGTPGGNALHVDLFFSSSRSHPFFGKSH